MLSQVTLSAWLDFLHCNWLLAKKDIEWTQPCQMTLVGRKQHSKHKHKISVVVKLFPNISTASEQIHIFRTSTISKSAWPSPKPYLTQGSRDLWSSLRENHLKWGCLFHFHLAITDEEFEGFKIRIWNLEFTRCGDSEGNVGTVSPHEPKPLCLFFLCIFNLYSLRRNFEN